jgi:PEP-CTERM motif
MSGLFKTTLMGVLLTVMLGLAAAETKADPVTFSTTGVFSVSGTNVVNFANINGTTTITFNGTTNPVNTPAGTSFGDLVVTTTVPANLLGPAIGGNFTLNFIQVSPAGMGSLVGTLDGTLGFNSGIATLTFTTTSINIGGFTYTVNPVYTIALPVTGVGGGAGTGTTTIQGTVTGSAIPEPTSMFLLGTGLLGVAGAVRKRFKRQ